MRRNKRQFFTLFEFVIALALFVMVTMTASVALSAFVQGWQKIKINQARQEDLHQITITVASAFRNAIPFTWRDEESLAEKPVFIGETERVVLAYRHRLNETEGAIRFLELKLENNQLLANYSSTPPRLQDSEQKVEILAENIESISFLYADKFGDDLTWYDSWDTTTTTPLPTAIQLEIVWLDGTVTRWLRRTAGVDYTGSKYYYTPQ